VNRFSPTPTNEEGEKHMKKPMILLGALAAATAFAAQADEQPVSGAPTQPAAEQMETEEDETSLVEVSLTLDVNSAYVSHNRIFSDTPVAQYDLWMQLNLPEDFGWLAFDVWATRSSTSGTARACTATAAVSSADSASSTTKSSTATPSDR